MQPEQITAANRATLEAIEKHHNSEDRGPLPETPYFGYINVTLFECPPFVMFTNNDSPVVQQILYRRSFEPMSMKLWCRLCQSATGILDIGANVGVYSLAAAASRRDLAVHAFEPNPYAYARLRIHKEINALSNIVEHAVAVGHANASVAFSWRVKPGGAIASGGGLVASKGSHAVEKITVQMITLDGTGLATTLGERPLVKIDVEGSELATIKGMSEVLALRPDILIETLHPTVAEQLNKVVMPLGYNAYHVQEHEMRLVTGDRIVAQGDAAGKLVSQDFNNFLTVRTVDEVNRLADGQVS